MKKKYNSKFDWFYYEMITTVKSNGDIIRMTHYQNATLIDKYNLVVTILNEERKTYDRK